MKLYITDNGSLSIDFENEAVKYRAYEKTGQVIVELPDGLRLAFEPDPDHGMKYTGFYILDFQIHSAQ